MKLYAARLKTVIIFDNGKLVCLLTVSSKTLAIQSIASLTNMLRLRPMHCECSIDTLIPFLLSLLHFLLYECRKSSSIFLSVTLSSIQASLHTVSWCQESRCHMSIWGEVSCGKETGLVASWRRARSLRPWTQQDGGNVVEIDARRCRGCGKVQRLEQDGGEPLWTLGSDDARSSELNMQGSVAWKKDRAIQ